MLVSDLRTGQRRANSYYCADCGPRAILVVRWNAVENSHEIVCGKCRQGEHFERRKSLTQIWRENPDAVPITMANKLERKYGGNPMDNHALARMDKAEMEQRIAGARWMHQLSPDQQRTLAEIAVRYGYDPLMNEVTVYEGKIYITVDGALRDAKRIPQFQGIQVSPMTQQEREARGIKQPIAYKAELYRSDWKVPAVGIGIADPNDPIRNNPVERKQPHALAEARAIRRAVRMAREQVSPFAGPRVDVETGEIIEVAIAEPENGKAETAFEIPNDPPEEMGDFEEIPDPEPPPIATPAPQTRNQPNGQGKRTLAEYIARYDTLAAEAEALGVAYDPLGKDPLIDAVAEKGRSLKARIDQHRANTEA